MNSNNSKFLSDNVKRIQKTEKRIKIFEYLKILVYLPMDSFFFRKHSFIDVEKRWWDELNSNLYFYHRKTNSFSVATGYVGSKSFVLANQSADKNGRLFFY